MSGRDGGSDRAAAPLVCVGPGARASLPVVLERLSATRVLLLVGRTSSQRPWRREVEAQLAGTEHRRCEHGAEQATEASVAAVVRAVEEAGADAIVALGGGTVMDAAKAAAAALRRAGGSVAVVAVPTTPGTGAEVTPFATVWDSAGGRKRSVSGPDVAPDAAIVDPELTATLAPQRMIAFAMDALTQGAEAAWSVRSTPASAAHGVGAVGLVADACDWLRARPSSIGARSALALAGLQSGHAIAVSQTTACHALSYPLTLRYGRAHADACSATLSRVMAFNAAVEDRDCTDPRGAAHVRGVVARIAHALGASEVAAAQRRVEALRRIGGLAPLASPELDPVAVAEDAVTYGRLANNPRRCDAAALASFVADEPAPERSLAC